MALYMDSKRGIVHITNDCDNSLNDFIFMVGMLFDQFVTNRAILNRI